MEDYWLLAYLLRGAKILARATTGDLIYQITRIIAAWIIAALLPFDVLTKTAQHRRYGG